MSLYGTKVHFACADGGESGASVTHAYSSLRQKENILSDRRKHHLHRRSAAAKSELSIHKMSTFFSVKALINILLFITASDVLNTFRIQGLWVYPVSKQKCPLTEKTVHYWSASLVSQVTNLQASESLGKLPVLRCPCVFW